MVVILSSGSRTSLESKPTDQSAAASNPIFGVAMPTATTVTASKRNEDFEM
jgi:hypothetical protein